jgi:hypothetical protein
MHKNLLRASLVFLVAISVVAQQGRAVGEWPSAERLRERVTYLASDKLEGRRTGTPGARLAAEYIVREFARYRLRPGGTEAVEDRRYMQQFPFVAGVALGKGNVMLFTPRIPPLTGAANQTPVGAKSASSLDLRLGEDWMPLGFSSSRKLSDAPATFVGYGITAKDLSYDDYAGAAIGGRIAVAFAGTPDGDNPHGKFARYEGVRWKAIAAREAGALALVIIAREENFKDEPLVRLRYDNSSGDAGLPVVVISRQAAARILSTGGLPTPLAELEKIARNITPNATPGATPSGNPAIQQNLASLLANLMLTISTDIERRNAPASNVVGILEGTDPKLKTEAIVIGAHYDHLGRGGEGSLAPKEGEVHHGADDNASGVAGMLELARLFSTFRPRRTIIFIAFSGEEEGLLGSNYYVNHPAVPLTQTIAMINMDMIGRLKDNKLIVGGVGTSQEWRSWIEAANVPFGVKIALNTSGPVTTTGNNSLRGNVFIPLTSVIPDIGQPFSLTLNEDGYGPSDHASFYAKQVPVLFFWTGTHEDYHKPSDTADKIDYKAEARIISLIASVVRLVDMNERRPTFTVAKSEGAGRTMGFKVYLGTIPNYADSNDGLKLDGVREDSPAAKAGLKAGDVIVKLAGRDVRNVYDYTYILGEMKAGEEYEVEILRDGKPLKLKLTPAARK